MKQGNTIACNLFECVFVPISSWLQDTQIRRSPGCLSPHGGPGTVPKDEQNLRASKDFDSGRPQGRCDPRPAGQGSPVKSPCTWHVDSWQYRASLWLGSGGANLNAVVKREPAFGLHEQPLFKPSLRNPDIKNPAKPHRSYARICHETYPGKMPTSRNDSGQALNCDPQVVRTTRCPRPKFDIYNHP